MLAEDFVNSRHFIELSFDDLYFSCLKLFLWLIGCLNKFDASIEDKLQQLGLFCIARINSYHSGDNKLQNDGLGKTQVSSINWTDYTMSSTILAKINDLIEQAKDLQKNLENLQLGF